MVCNTKQNTLYTPIKINLALHVIGLLENNYHELESLVVFSLCGDKISIEEAKEDAFHITGSFATQLNNENSNLILKARDKLRNFATSQNANCVPVAINLQKELPVASGLGGGSGDAAVTLILLNNLWNLKLTEAKLFKLAAELSADVPACLHYLLHKKALYMSGLGDKLAIIEHMPNFFLLLVNDLEPLSTKSIFDNLNNKNNKNLDKQYQFATLSDLLNYLTQTRNDLYPSAIKFKPNIVEIHKKVEETGAIFTTMSGSGATIVGVFETQYQANLAAISIRKSFPTWFIKLIDCSV